MRTILYPGGAAVRVWAPFGPAVFAAGSFHGQPHRPSFPEGGKPAQVRRCFGAKVGVEYKFDIPHGSGLPHDGGIYFYG